MTPPKKCPSKGTWSEWVELAPRLMRLRDDLLLAAIIEWYTKKRRDNDNQKDRE